MSAYKCHKCDHTTSRKTSLAQHVKRLHEEVEEEDPDHFSPEDDVMSESPAKTGKSHNVGRKKFKCNFCPHVAATHEAYIEHAIKHMNESIRGNDGNNMDNEDITENNADSDLHSEGETSDMRHSSSSSVTNQRVAAALKTSLQEHLTQKNIQEEKKSVYKCEKCEYRSTWPGNVTKHFKNVHEKVKNDKI